MDLLLGIGLIIAGLGIDAFKQRGMRSRYGRTIEEEGGYDQERMKILQWIWGPEYHNEEGLNIYEYSLKYDVTISEAWRRMAHKYFDEHGLKWSKFMERGVTVCK